MKIGGSRRKAAVQPTDLSPLHGPWSPLIHEGGAGFWQRGKKIDQSTALTFSSLFACVTLIASDIAKLGLRLEQKTQDGIWQEIDNPAFSPVLRRPNRYQTRIQFIEQWALSKLLWGNTYVFKVRDERNVVVALYVLDPRHVQPLVAPGAAVFYRLQADNLSTLNEPVTVPSSEIIHDRMNAFHHPLVGISPIQACNLAAQQGIEIQRTSSRFFENGARPGGVLTAPGTINKETAERLREQWDNNFGTDNVGKTAVLGDGLKFEHLSVNPVDAQLIEQLKYSSEMVCTAFHVPPYKVGVGPTPTYQNATTLNQIYYTDCLQTHLEHLELVLGEGLKLPRGMRLNFNVDDLLRMDAESKIKTIREGVEGSLMRINEGRRALNLPGVEGGDTIWQQQQYFSLEALARRDQGDPFGERLEAEIVEPEDDTTREMIEDLRKSLVYHA